MYILKSEYLVQEKKALVGYSFLQHRAIFQFFTDSKMNRYESFVWIAHGIGHLSIGLSSGARPRECEA